MQLLYALLSVVVSVGLVGVLLYLPMRMAGIIE